MLEDSGTTLLKIYLVDFGNYDTVSITNTRTIKSAFLSVSQMCVKVALIDSQGEMITGIENHMKEISETCSEHIMKISSLRAENGTVVKMNCYLVQLINKETNVCYNERLHQLALENENVGAMETENVKGAVVTEECVEPPAPAVTQALVEETVNQPKPSLNEESKPKDG